MRRADLRAWAGRHPQVTDVVWATGITTMSVASSQFGPNADGRPLGVQDVALALVGLTIASLRRIAPLAALAAVATLTVVAIALGFDSGITGGPLVVTVWAVAVNSPRRTSLRAAGLVALVLLARAIVAEGIVGLRPENVNLVFLTLLAAAAGDATRERRAHLAALRERAERAERTRETEAARRVAEERLRIARDLHDLLAHHMAVVSVQAGVAEHLLDSDPVAAKLALGHARSAASQVLNELGTVLGVLRNDEDAEATEPAPTLSRLANLVDPLRAAGLDLRSTVNGAPFVLPPAVDQTAYRVVQEALTNAHKHARGGATRLALTYLPTELIIEVVNTAGSSDRGAPPTAGAGFGLTGMRERCTAVGGALQALRTADGGFLVRATLPLLPSTVAGRSPKGTDEDAHPLPRLESGDRSWWGKAGTA